MAGTNSERIRKPGEAFELTDEELLAAPVRMLTPDQRRKRRQLRNNISKQNTRERRQARKRGDLGASVAKIRQCQGTNKAGEPCGAYAVTGAQHCTIHLTDEEKDRLGVIEPDRSSGGRPKTNINANQLMREVVEAAMHKVIKPHFDALGAEFIGFNEEGLVVVRDLGPDAGLMLHGESKDGDINMTNHPDIGGRINAAEKLLDRTYGKPRQTQVIEGGSKPVQVQPVRSVERSHQMGTLLGQLGLARPPDLPGGPEPLPDVEVRETSEVVQLRPSDEH